MDWLRFRQENRESLNRLMTLICGHCDPSWWPDLHACLPRLMALVEEAGDQPVRQLQPKVHMILREHCSGGDRPLPPPDPHGLDRQVRHVLDALRRFRLEHHHISTDEHDPVPPLMFG